MKYIFKKVIPVEAVQWWGHGDHPNVRKLEDTDDMYFTGMGGTTLKLEHEDRTLYGVIGTLESPNHLVSPGDWILTGVRGENWPVKPDIFEETYDEVYYVEDLCFSNTELKKFQDTFKYEVCDFVSYNGIPGVLIPRIPGFYMFIECSVVGNKLIFPDMHVNMHMVSIDSVHRLRIRMTT